MKNGYCCLAVLILFGRSLMAQDVYTVSGGEIIFQSSRVEQNGNDLNSNLRFTMAFHAGEYLHIDLGDNIGLFSGIGLRNVGFITDENHLKIKYRTYNLGVPVALKLGSFKKNLFVFGGAEYEWMFQFKQKVFENGKKTKYTSFMSNRTPDFIPSAFIGFQFPAGVQIKFRYYLDNYLNEKFDGGTAFTDYTGFNHIQVWYISLSFMIRNNRIKDYRPTSTDMAMH